jgi:hypothetical protein
MIMNQADIFPIPNDCKLNPFQEPVPTVCVLTLNKSKSNRKQLMVSIHSNSCQHLQFILSYEKSPIDAKERPAVLQCVNAWTQAEKDPLQYVGRAFSSV